MHAYDDSMLSLRAMCVCVCVCQTQLGLNRKRAGAFFADLVRRYGLQITVVSVGKSIHNRVSAPPHLLYQYRRDKALLTGQPLPELPAPPEAPEGAAGDAAGPSQGASGAGGGVGGVPLPQNPDAKDPNYRAVRPQRVTVRVCVCVCVCVYVCVCVHMCLRHRSAHCWAEDGEEPASVKCENMLVCACVCVCRLTWVTTGYVVSCSVLTHTGT